MRHLKRFRLFENEYPKELKPIVEELENTPVGRDVLALAGTYSKGTGNTIDFPVQSTLGSDKKKAIYFYIVSTSAKPTWAIIKQVGITHNSTDHTIGIPATLRALWARLAIYNIGKPFVTDKAAGWLKDPNCPLHGTQPGLDQIKEYLVDRLKQSTKEKEEAKSLWEHIPSVEQLNNLLESISKYDFFTYRFVPYKDTGIGSRKMEALGPEPVKSGSMYVFYPNKLRIEDGRYIIMKDIKLETLEDWTIALKKLINSTAASILNAVDNENNPDVAYSGDNKRPYNQNKIELLKTGVGLEKLITKQIFWDSTEAKSIILWVLTNPIEMIKKLMESGAVVNYELILKELIASGKIDEWDINQLDPERIKKLTRAANLLKRNTIPLPSRQERIDIRNRELINQRMNPPNIDGND